MPSLGTSFGRGGATDYQQDLMNSDCIVIMGSNMAENHPVGFQWVMEARERGAKVIHVDPRRQCPRVRRLHGSAQPERVSSTKLPGDRPPGDQLSKRHFSTGFLAEWDVFKPNVGRYN